MTKDVKAPAATEATQATGAGDAGTMEGSLFPYDTQTDHWDIDFNDTEQSYEGHALPVWILAGWAAFIIWAVVYLIAGLPSAF